MIYSTKIVRITDQSMSRCNGLVSLQIIGSIANKTRDIHADKPRIQDDEAIQLKQHRVGYTCTTRKDPFSTYGRGDLFSLPQLPVVAMAVKKNT
jgi:hypothetical protein